jgi:hypothetical protein
VGKPCAHRQLHLVDWEDGNNGEGELWITGPGLSFGYLGQPEVTDQAFQELPAQAKGPSGPPGRRAYKTGDVLRWNKHDELVFCGRVDHQVKIRGNRVELGEIEAVFKGTKEQCVTECMVIAEGSGEGMRLVAFVSPKTVDVTSIAKSASVKLPAYMMPSRILAIDEWPRGSTGKVDRKALAALAAESVGPEDSSAGIALEQDSLGQMRMRRGKLDPREVTLLANMRTVLCLGLLQTHLLMTATGRAFLPSHLVPQSQWTIGATMTGLLTAPLWTFDHTTVFMFLVGFQDSLDVDPFVWKARDTVVLIYCFFFRFVVLEITSWWSLPFVWVRLLAVVGHRLGGRIGRIMTYAAWLAFCIWVRETQCPGGMTDITSQPLTPAGSWIFGWPIPGIGPGFFFPGYMLGATLGNFEAMHWLGLELGPLLRSCLQRHNFFAHLQGRSLIALAFLVLLVFIPWAFPMSGAVDPAAFSEGMICFSSLMSTPKDLIRPALNALGATFALGGFVLFTFPAGWHLPPTWVLSSVLISVPLYTWPYHMGATLNLSPNFLKPWLAQMQANVTSAPQGWLWVILLVVAVWALMITYYIIVGVLTHEVGRWIGQGCRMAKRCCWIARPVH